MQLPEFIKEVIWSLYPPKYKQLSQRPYKMGLKYMSKLLLAVLLISSLLLLPKIALLNGDIKDNLGKFSSIQLIPNIQQTDRFAVPESSPWIVIDLNNNLTLQKEFFLIDKDSVQYRFFTPKSVEMKALLQPTEYKAQSAGFLMSMIVLMLPGIFLLLFVRLWLKYLLISFIFGSALFMLAELTKFRMKWKQMMNIATYALTIAIIIEAFIAGLFAQALFPIPSFRFLGLNIYMVPLAIYAIVMVAGIIGCQLPDKKK